MYDQLVMIPAVWVVISKDLDDATTILATFLCEESAKDLVTRLDEADTTCIYTYEIEKRAVLR